MTTWVVVIAVGAGSYVLRALPLLLGGRGLASPAVERMVGLAGTAALAALVVSGLQRAPGTPGGAVVTVAVAGAGLAVAVRGGSMPKVLLGGGAVFLAALLGAAVLG